MWSPTGFEMSFLGIFYKHSRNRPLYIALCLPYYRKLTMHFINAIIVVLQYPYFNNESSSARILFQHLGVTIRHKNWVQNVFRLVFVLIRFPERIVLQSFFLKYPFTVISSVFSCRYVCWEVCIAHCFRKFSVDLMYVNLTSGKFALILCNVNFLRVVNVHPQFPIIRYPDCRSFHKSPTYSKLFD